MSVLGPLTPLPEYRPPRTEIQMLTLYMSAALVATFVAGFVARIIFEDATRDARRIVEAAQRNG